MCIKKISDKIKNYSIEFYNKVKTSFLKTHQGEESLNKTLWLWGVLPAVLVVFFLEERLRKFPNIISLPIHIAIIAFFAWHIFAIRTTIKKHPEYKKKKKEDGEDKYKGLTKKQIKEAKKEEKKEKSMDILKKAMLIKAWDTMEFYKIVILIDCFVILTQLQRILYIL